MSYQHFVFAYEINVCQHALDQIEVCPCGSQGMGLLVVWFLLLFLYLILLDFANNKADTFSVMCGILKPQMSPIPLPF